MTNEEFDAARAKAQPAVPGLGFQWLFTLLGAFLVFFDANPAAGVVFIVGAGVISVVRSIEEDRRKAV
jgi:hypothetical protein